MQLLDLRAHQGIGPMLLAWLVLMSPLARSLLAQNVQLGPSGPVVVPGDNDKPTEPPKTGVTREEPHQPRVSTLRLRPTPEPVPALRHVLVPEYQDINAGNAAPYYYRAIMRLNDVDSKTLKKMQELEQLAVEDLATTDRSNDVDMVLRDFGRVLHELDVAVHRERCDWDWRLRDRNGREQISFLLEEIQEMRTFGRMLSLKVGNHLAEREFEDAVKTLMMGYRMAQDVGEPPILINDLVGIAIASTMNKRLVEFINTPDSPNMYWAISTLPRPLISMRDGFQHERALPYKFFPSLRDPESVQRTKEEWRRIFDEQFTEFMKTVAGSAADADNPLTSTAAIAAATYPRAKRELIAQGFDKETVDAMAVAQVIAIHESRILRRVSDDLFKWSLLPYHEADGWIEEVDVLSFDAFRDGGESLPIAGMLLPAVAAAAKAEVRLHTELDGIRAVEAIRMQMAKDDGKIPAALEDVNVVPVPSNPSTNRPFVYRPMPQGEGRVLELIPGKNPIRQMMWKLELIPSK